MTILCFGTWRTREGLKNRLGFKNCSGQVSSEKINRLGSKNRRLATDLNLQRSRSTSPPPPPQVRTTVMDAGHGSQRCKASNGGNFPWRRESRIGKGSMERRRLLFFISRDPMKQLETALVGYPSYSAFLATLMTPSHPIQILQKQVQRGVRVHVPNIHRHARLQDVRARERRRHQRELITGNCGQTVDGLSEHMEQGTSTSVCCQNLPYYNSRLAHIWTNYYRH
jgi:hypothetical protein